MRTPHFKRHEEFAKKLRNAKTISTYLFISPWQRGYKLKDCNPPRGCACSHQVIEAAQQFHHRDGFRFPLKEETFKNKWAIIQRVMYHNVHCSAIYNSQDMEAT